MSLPTDRERELLETFRNNLSDLKLTGYWNEDTTLVQWLRARNLNLNQAEDMLRKSLQWRADNQVDSVLTWKCPEIFNTLLPFHHFGYDKENSPCSFNVFGRWDARKVYQLGHRNDFIKFVHQFLEVMRERTKGRLTPSGQPVTQSILMVDVKGLPLRTLTSLGTVNMLLDGARDMEANYPETMKKIIIFNASAIFSSFFALLKPILSKATVDKIEFCKNDPESMKNTLLKYLTEDQILPSFVSNWKCSWSSISTSSPDFPPDQNSPKEEVDNLEVKIKQRDKLVVQVQVTTPKSVLSWSFATKDYDIKFGVLKDEKEIVSIQTVNSHLEEQEGLVVCETEGLYQIVFDNSQSLLTDKILTYRIEVNQPDESSQLSPDLHFSM